MNATTCTNCGCTELRACPGGCSRCPTHLAAWRYQQAEPNAQQRRDLLQIGPTDI